MAATVLGLDQQPEACRVLTPAPTPLRRFWSPLLCICSLHSDFFSFPFKKISFLFDTCPIHHDGLRGNRSACTAEWRLIAQRASWYLHLPAQHSPTASTALLISNAPRTMGCWHMQQGCNFTARCRVGRQACRRQCCTRRTKVSDSMMKAARALPGKQMPNYT